MIRNSKITYRDFKDISMEIVSNIANPVSIKLNTILLIDDEAVINFVHKRVIELSELTKNIEIASSADQAIEILMKCKLESSDYPELIFLDINMPRKNGFDFLDTINKVFGRNQLNIIALSSSVDPKDIQRMKEMGVEDYLFKPLTEDDILDLIQKYF